MCIYISAQLNKKFYVKKICGITEEVRLRQI